MTDTELIEKIRYNQAMAKYHEYEAILLEGKDIGFRQPLFAESLWWRRLRAIRALRGART